MLLLALLSFTAFASEEIAAQSPFDTLSAQPVCYGREYSAKHMESHPLQTVKQLKLKFYRDEYTNDTSAILEVKADLKREVKEKDSGETYTVIKPYHTGMGCTLEGGSVNCAIDCDGGSASATWDMKKSGAEITFVNKGFVMFGGCGEEGETIWLDPKKGGDDVFQLYQLPKEFCQQ
jgi:hypothetical protein